MLGAESMSKQTPRKQMHSTLTPDQQAMLQAAIGGTELKDRPVPYLTKQQRDELRAMVHDGFEMDAWREVERAFRIAMQKSYEKMTKASRESAEHNARMAVLKAQAVAAQKQNTGTPPTAKEVHPAQASEAGAPDMGKPTPSKDGRVTEKREKQIQAIEKAARDLGYSDQLKIPTGGRAAIKTHCIATTFGHSESAFDRAWTKANKQGRIRLAEKEKYM